MTELVYAKVECPSNEYIEKVNEMDLIYENKTFVNPFYGVYENGESIYIRGNHIILRLLPDKSIDIPFDKVMLERTIEIFQDALDREAKE